MTASQWEGPEHEEKTVRWESKSKEQGAAQVLATMWGVSGGNTRVLDRPSPKHL